MVTGPDIRQYLEIKTAMPTGFAADGSKVLVQSNLTGTMQLYVVPRTGGPLRQITDFAEPVSGSYLPVGDDIVMTMDAGGNERHQIYLLDDDGGVPRPITDDPDHIYRPGGTTRDGRLLAYASNARNGKDFDVYVRPLLPEVGEARIVFDQGGWCQPSGFSPDGAWLAVIRLTERNGDNDLYLVGVETGEVIHVSPHDDEASFTGPSWMPDSSAFFFVSDTGRDSEALARFDMRERRWDYVLERDWPMNCHVDWTGRRLLLDITEDGYTRAELLDPATLEVQDTVPLPGRGLASFRFSRDGRYLTYVFMSPVENSDVWLYDCDERTTTRLTTSPRAIPASDMVEPTLHRFASFDGEQVPVFLYQPTTPPTDGRGLPVIVWVHGGPEGQYLPNFNSLIQYFVARGFAVAAPNVRGSVGYGKRYHHLDDVRKRLDSVADLGALHGWLRSQPGVDGARAALMGGSYGGYMVLAGLAFQPELWAAGVDIVGISSLLTFLENTSIWRRAFREREYGSLEHDRDFLIEVSPITHVDRMRAPLFIIHGANDPRVPLGEAEQIYKVLCEKGVRTELVVYDDEGHGLAKLKNRLDAYPRAADFLVDVLGA